MGEYIRTAEMQQKALAVHRILLDYYGLPTWREPLPPVDELISTILSQNTNDRNRDAAFYALRARFPSWEEVRDAPVDQVVDTIRVAGLANQKGPRIQALLRQITQEYGSLDLDFLRNEAPEAVREWLLRFNGVGPKTAAIVMQFSLGIAAFPVDTHIYRVAGRVGLLPLKMTVEQAHAHLEGLFLPDYYEADHLNIIRLGREVCQARQPKCAVCPLAAICDYYRTQAGQ